MCGRWRGEQAAGVEWGSGREWEEWQWGVGERGCAAGM